jgi:protein-tyrosine-phosphatase
MKRKVLFICPGNSSRSQMAAGILRARVGEGIDIFSAGSDLSVMSPLAVDVMNERAIDISQQQSRKFNGYFGQAFNDVVMLYDTATEKCPHFPGLATEIQWDVPNPAAHSAHEGQLAAFRQVRDDLEVRLKEWPTPFVS